MPEREAAAKASVTAAKLALGASLEMLSLALAMLALVGCTMAEGGTLAALAVSLALGAAQLAYGLRVRFDRQVFAIWATSWPQPEARPAADMAAFDEATGRKGIRRGIDARATGALRLLRRQAALLGTQAVVLGIAAALSDW